MIQMLIIMYHGYIQDYLNEDTLTNKREFTITVKFDYDTETFKVIPFQKVK